jgi:hypothetical protein
MEIDSCCSDTTTKCCRHTGAKAVVAVFANPLGTTRWRTRPSLAKLAYQVFFFELTTLDRK